MRHKSKISLAASILIVVVLIFPGLGIAGSLDPPPHAVDESGNPVPTILPKFACRGAFMYNYDGTVTDCKTGMIWMQNASCFGEKLWGDDAFLACASLKSGSCGLADGSSAGAWHLPTIDELRTLPDRAYSYPAFSNAKGAAQWIEGDPFTNLPSDGNYWSSTTWAHNPSYAFVIDAHNGDVSPMMKINDNHIWCVRRGN